MKFKVNGDLNLPETIVSLLLGVSDVKQDVEQDFEIVLSQKALDRLSCILHMIYTTKSINEVELMLKELKCNSDKKPNDEVRVSGISNIQNQSFQPLYFQPPFNIQSYLNQIPIQPTVTENIPKEIKINHTNVNKKEDIKGTENSQVKSFNSLRELSKKAINTM